MDETLRMFLVYGAIPTVIGLGTWCMKTLLTRLDELERAMPRKLEDTEVRRMMSDKIDPIRQDIQELQVKLDKIVDLLLKR